LSGRLCVPDNPTNGEQDPPTIDESESTDSASRLTPDKYTKKHSAFFEGGAPGQVFKFVRWGISYGTDDKGHAASIILSLIIAILLVLVLLIGAFTDRSWISDAFKLFGPIFTFVAGVAIGKSTSPE